jgi:tRNA(Ile)-lysidine synthase
VDPRARRARGGSRARLTLQEAARELRYAALRELAQELGATRIATAHHADDQAETVMLRILRGTGPDGLTGIPERSPDGLVVRPLLRLSREELHAHATQHGVVWREDASNASREYARSRLRHDWLPGLARDFNPRLLRAIADLAEAQRRDREWIDALVQLEATSRLAREGDWLRIDARRWDELPEALARRVAREALTRAGAGRHATRAHLARMQAFLTSGRPGSRLELPGSLLLLRDRRGFRLGAASLLPESAC